MKLFKKLALFFASVPLLVSCANGSIAGTYGFQLGKDTGTHFGMFLALSDEAFVPEQGDETQYEEGLKKFDFTISVNMGDDEGDAGTASVIDNILDYFRDDDGNAVIPGYYKLTDETNPKGERRIKLGISFNYIAEKIAKAAKEEGDTDINTDDLNMLNNAAIIQNLLCATYKDETVNIYVPVSLEDLYYQLYWYGTDLHISIDLDAEDISDLIKITIVEVTKHDFGTLPTKDEVAAINQTYKQDHSNCTLPFVDVYNEFRLFHQIKLGLSKK